MFTKLKGLRLFKSVGTNLVSLICIIFFLSAFTSCVEKASSGRKTKTSNPAATEEENTNSPTDPTFSGEANFLQSNGSQFSSTMPIAGDHSVSIYLRGPQVNQYLTNEAKTDVQCLVIPYNSPSIQKTLVVAAFPRFFFNFETNAQEYYYEFEIFNETNNRSFCQKPGILSYVASDFPSHIIAYHLDNVCPNCNQSLIRSESFQLHNQSGQRVSDVNLINLKLEIRPRVSTGDGSINSCTSSDECSAKGFDCCSLGQCVNDKQIKSDVNQDSAAFLQAMADIRNNPSAILLYGEFFHLCTQTIPDNPTPTPVPDPAVGAGERLLELKALFDCTTPSEGELAVCETRYDNVQRLIENNSSNVFETNRDDRNFNSIYTGTKVLKQHSIKEVTYAGLTLFSNGSIVQGMTIGPNGDGSGNDNLFDKQIINLTQTPPSSPPNDELVIRYSIDGSCERLSSSLARCFKVYVQGQNDGLVTDHFPVSNTFLLPRYADISKTVTVTVDDAPTVQFSDWNVVNSTPPAVTFTGTGTVAFSTQEVRINYLVNLNSNPNVLLEKEIALEEIKTRCQCSNTDCRLAEKFNEKGELIDFTCSYPKPDLPAPPLQQTVLLSAKNTPHRYFDIQGIYQSTIEDAVFDQEGTEFKYTNNDILKPNNVDNYIGFNEIYGSYTKKANSALPAKEVRVEAGKTYDIYTNFGSFSTCLLCGSDYYSVLTKIFPQSFLQNGGGYFPDFSNTNPFTARNFRKDDLLFGRACWVPATMIPWSHRAGTTRQAQRQDRLAAQHFLFANGYQRDWYGFDYGSVIGSFDGVKWFSIGNKRRITSTTNKLFVAINGYFGDLSESTTYSVTVQDTSSIGNVGVDITSDFDSDGAECQKAHVCQTDGDCASQLGWEYACETVTSMRTNWPRFDVNALEIPGVSDQHSLVSLFNQNNGTTKRCVYRGRGALCQRDYNQLNSGSTYTGTIQAGLHACSSNNYCQTVYDGSRIPRFNDRIARFGKSVKSQNASESVEEDELDVLGLGARTLGRPYSYFGGESVPNEAVTNLLQNNANAICLPGRSSELVNVFESNREIPEEEDRGDQINAMGVTPSLSIGVSGNSRDYLARCSIFDDNENYFLKDRNNASISLSADKLVDLSGRQALSTNLLDIFESPSFASTEMIQNFENEFIEEFNFQENRCLRAPGAKCFSDIDCAPNSVIAERMRTVANDDPGATSIINTYEIAFWQEELVCSQEVPSTDEDFDQGENRCCRETGKEMLIGTAEVLGNDTGRNLDFNTLPAVNTPINSRTRNSRLSTIWDLIGLEATGNGTAKYIKTAKADACASGSCANAETFLNNQFRSFAEIGSRTCCSKNWVRHFDSDANGGGHAWSPSKFQTIPKDTFRCYNYALGSGDRLGDDPDDDFTGFTCSHTVAPTDPNCRARSVSDSEAAPIFEWMGTLELAGIPQITVSDENNADLHCVVNPTDQSDSTFNQAPPGIINSGAAKEYSTATREYAAHDPTNFAENIKQVFSKDEFSCCLPAGTNVGTDGDPAQCCTGYIGEQTGLCQLPPYTDVTLYLNKYVSSEAQNEPNGVFDAKTGYLNSKNDVFRLACEKRLCESGQLIEGVALNSYFTRGHEGNIQGLKIRFIDGDDQANSQNGLNVLYDRGLKWNTHLYCSDPLSATGDLDEEDTESFITTFECP